MNLAPFIQRGDKGGEELCGVLAEFGFQKLDEIGDVPRDGHFAGSEKRRVGERRNVFTNKHQFLLFQHLPL